MNLMKDLDEFTISADIVSRMALVALATACDRKTIETVFEAISERLLQVYDKDKAGAMIEQYKKAALLIRENVEEDLSQDG